MTAFGRSIHELFTLRAKRHPQNTALIAPCETVGYATLDAAADVYAGELSRRGVGPGRIVPVLLPRSPRLVATLLAILKCGAAYTALDHRWPVNRVQTLLRVLDCPLAVADSLPGTEVSLWCPPPERLSRIARQPGRPPCRTDDGALATVFFTSGTSGRPKGVLSPHRATTRLFRGPTFAEFGPGHTMPLAAPVSWDAFSLELWGPLTTGGSCAIVESDYLVPQELRAMVSSAGVDTLWLTSSLFNIFVDEDLACFRGLRQVITGGERLSVPHVSGFMSHHPDIVLINGYGPVESCVFATTRTIEPSDRHSPHGIPIGAAVPGTKVHILDGERPVPPGRTGEICLSGEGLALGYAGDPRASAERFVRTMIAGAPVDLYRTGDLGVVDTEGVLHFQGRTDRQIKRAGHRIEPGEVESMARRVPGLRDCAVVPAPGPDGVLLVMYYTVEDGSGLSLTPHRVRGALSEHLPRHLMPDICEQAESLPLTPNGKLDLASLTRSISMATRYARS